MFLYKLLRSVSILNFSVSKSCSKLELLFYTMVLNLLSFLLNTLKSILSITSSEYYLAVVGLKTLDYLFETCLLFFLRLSGSIKCFLSSILAFIIFSCSVFITNFISEILLSIFEIYKAFWAISEEFFSFKFESIV